MVYLNHNCKPLLLLYFKPHLDFKKAFILTLMYPTSVLPQFYFDNVWID